MRRLAATAVMMLCAAAFAADAPAKPKPSPAEALMLLKEGNARFLSGKSAHPRSDLERVKLAGTSDQADYAYATVIACSDSRVPVERLFDAGVMDLFVIRVAGNVVDTDEAGSIEYGLAHVKTPVLVVLGHTQCGAVNAVTQAALGHGHALERNIPPLVDNIAPAVARARLRFPALKDAELVAKGIEENVWQSIEDLFVRSAAVRKLAKDGTVKVVGAVYDVGSAEIRWLDEAHAAKLLEEAEQNPKRATEAMAEPAAKPEEAAPKP